MAPPLLPRKPDKSQRQMFVLNTLFGALLLAFNPTSILSFPQKAVVKQVSVTAREKPQKQGSSFAQYLPPPIFFGCLIRIFSLLSCRHCTRSFPNPAPGQCTTSLSNSLLVSASEKVRSENTCRCLPGYPAWEQSNAGTSTICSQTKNWEQRHFRSKVPKWMK